MKLYYEDPLVQIYNGHALDVLRSLPDESVQLVMTSPPYWGLRNYLGSELVWGGDPDCRHEWVADKMRLQHENRNNLRGTQEEVAGSKPTTFIMKYDTMEAGFCLKCGAWKGQLGLEPDPDLYVEHLMMVFQEVKRILKKDGAFYLNVGDTYMGSGQGWSKAGKDTPGPNSIDNRDVSIRPGRGEPGAKGRPPSAIYNHPTIPPKCMVCIPERVMFAMIADGWILRNKIVWSKPNHMPSSVKDRFTGTWEYIYFFVKQRKYYFDLDAVREPYKESSLSRSRGMGVVPFNLRVRDVKRGKGGTYVEGGKVKQLKASQEEVESYQYPEGMHRHHGSRPQRRLTGLRRYEIERPDPEIVFHPNGKNPGDLWDIPLKPFPEAHFAVYPEELCVRPILASSREGDVVLDPFAGSGTTGVVAKKLGRRVILIDIIESYCDLAKRRVQQVPVPLTLAHENLRARSGRQEIHQKP